MPTFIRRAEAADAHTVTRLLTDFNAEFDTPTPEVTDLGRRWERLLAREDVLVFLAEYSVTHGVSDKAVGFAYLTLRPTPYWDGPLAQLEELYVVPGNRGSGIGSAVMDEAVNVLARKGCEEIHINVDEPDHDARRFYERHRFTNVEVGQDYRMLCYIRELS